MIQVINFNSSASLKVFLDMKTTPKGNKRVSGNQRVSEVLFQDYEQQCIFWVENREHLKPQIYKAGNKCKKLNF